MALLSGNIGQLTVPSDGIGLASVFAIDHANSLLFAINQNGIRKYSIALPIATQAPIVSTATLLNNVLAIAIDGSGNPIIGSTAANTSNGQPIYKIDPTTLAAGAHYGTSNNFPSYPTSVWALQEMVCLTVSGVSYAVMKESEGSPFVAVIRTDNMTASGFYANCSTGVLGRSWICAGVNSGAAVSAFLVDQTTAGAVASVGVFKVTIGAGAETYNIASWPSTNPFISSSKIGTVSAASIDPGFATMSTNSIGYDSGSNVVLLSVVMSDNSTAYLVGINPANAAVIWKTPIVGGFGSDIINLGLSTVTVGAAAMVGNGAVNAVQTASGTLASDNITGLANQVTTSNDVTKTLIAYTAYTAAGSSLVAASGTASTFTGLAYMDSFPVFPPPPPPPVPVVGTLTGPLGGWRGIVGINWLGMALVGDAFAGLVGLSDFAAFTEYGNPMTMLITSPPIQKDRKRVFIRKFEVDIQAATADANTPNPQLVLDYSKDSGMTWQPLLIARSMGQIGQYTKRLRWLNLGESRSWVLRIRITDPVRRTVIGTYIDLAQGAG